MQKCKISSSKEIDLYRDFTAGVYLPEAQNPIPAPPYTLYKCILTQRRGKGGRERGERSNSSQSLVENTNMTDGTSSL
jgi:hypothetical protein